MGTLVGGGAGQAGDAAELMARGLALHQAGQLGAAAVVYRQLLTQSPEHPDGLHMSGVLAFQLGQHERALGLLGRAQRYYPRLPALYVNQAAVLRALGRLDDAAVSLRTALSLAPGEVEALNGLSQLLLERGEVGPALEHAERAVQLAPSHAGALHTLGTVLLRGPGRPQLAQALACFRAALSLSPELTVAHTSLGGLLLRLGHPADAATSFARAVELSPADAQPCLYLGAALEKTRRFAEAGAAYREALRRRPGWNQAQFFLSALEQQQPPETAPPEYVAQLFDGYAQNFDHHLKEKLKYRAPELLVAAVQPHWPTATGRPIEVLDLGCGTGLLAPLVRPLAGRLCGVDLSTGMLAKARERQLYDELTCGELVATLGQRAAAFDVLLAADVLIYLGDLAPLFAAAAQALRPGGVLAFTVEALLDPSLGEELRLRPSRRYAHAAGYLRRLAAAERLRELSFAPAILRREGGNDIEGHIVVLSRPA